VARLNCDARPYVSCFGNVADNDKKVRNKVTRILIKMKVFILNSEFSF